MTEQEQKHWYNLGRQAERNERTYLESKEFWFGLVLGLITMNAIFAFIGF